MTRNIKTDYSRRAALAAAPVQPTQNGPEIDRLIDRLMSSDPDFDDCTKAAELIQREIKGPDGYATWRDAAIAERQRRVAAAPAQPNTHPTTGEPIGTDAQEATAWKLTAENLQRENAALREALEDCLEDSSNALQDMKERYGSHYPDRIARQERTIADAKIALAGKAPASKEKEYAELPKNRCVINTYMLSEDDARAFADATHALRTGGKPC